MRSGETRAEINLLALAHNFRVVQQKIAPGVNVTAVVKADAYGHGAVEIAGCLEKLGITSFGVSYSEEALQLRENGIKKAIIVFFDHRKPQIYIKYRLTPVINDLNNAYLFSREAHKQDTIVPIHINIDTGMGRLGISGVNALKEISEISSLPNLKIEGLMTHFSTSDMLHSKTVYKQLNEFLTIKKELNAIGITVSCCHCANSGAILSYPETHLDTVRPGIMLYGYSPDATSQGLKPVMTLKSSLIHLKKVPPHTPVSYGRTFITQKETLIGTLALGYADGYNRLLSNQAEALIRGKRVPVIGRVCMDLTMIDVTDIPEAALGDEVVLIGQQQGESISADEIAQKTGTISYEILTSISSRVKRVYIN